MDQRSNGSPYFSSLANRFVAVFENSLRGADQLLGYAGQDRFVVLYYEPRGEEVMWHDSHSCGFATGAWSVFLDDIAPVADLYNVDVGNGGTRATHVLLIDRREKRAYFAKRDEALQFLRAKGPLDGTAEPHMEIMRGEITHEAIMKLAYELWQKQGRPEGRAEQNWLEAESTLKQA